MSEHPNAALARRLFESLAARDAPTALALIAEDAVWRFPGRRGTASVTVSAGAASDADSDSATIYTVLAPPSGAP